MSGKKRFDYLQSQEPEQLRETATGGVPPGSTEATETFEEAEPLPSREEDPLRSVPRGEGRMEQDREQLNIRVPKLLKRRAIAKAVMEGRTVGEVIEDLLITYIGEAAD